MGRLLSFLALAAVTVFGAVSMAAQTLLLRRFLWRFESAETGVALFLSCWLLWSGLGAAAACTPPGRRLAGLLSHAVWLLVAACAGLYFAQYALIENLRGWLGVPEYQTFPLAHLALGCLLANAPFCFAAGFVIPSAARWFARLGLPVSRAFAWEALGAALGGLAVAALIVGGRPPDPRDEAEWLRYFPQAAERPARFETAGGTTFYGSHGGTFYALSSGGVAEIIPEGDRAMEQAALLLSQRPYAKDVLLAGDVPLAAGLALEALRPGLAIVWCPCDAAYGAKLLAAARSGGLETGVRAAGVALFGLGCEEAVLTPEKAALLDATVRGVRQAWPESGVFAPGAGGWWIAAQVPGLAYGAGDAAARFAMLKRDLIPAEAVARCYDPLRARQWAQQLPALNPEEKTLLPEEARPEEVLAAGLADAVRRAYPAATPGAWLSWLKALDGGRLAGLALVVLWMLPVALGGGARAPRRLAAAWLAACGSLGLAVSLAVLYRLQMRFGAIYLLAGVGSCLYLTGLFCGNRLGEGLLRLARGRPRPVRAALLLFTLAQAGAAFGVLAAAEALLTAEALAMLCFLAGSAAGLAVPTALAACGESREEDAAVFVLADALGAAVAGAAFVALVPLAGLWKAVVCFAALACGTALCAALGSRHARLTAGFALLAALAALGGQLRDVWPRLLPAAREAASAPEAEAPEPETVPPPVPAATNVPARAAERRLPLLRGIPRKVDVERIRGQMRNGSLSTNAASFWEPK